MKIRDIIFLIFIFIIYSCKTQPSEFIFDSDYDFQRWQQINNQYSILSNLEDKLLWAEDTYMFFDEIKKPDYLKTYFRQIAASNPDNSDDRTFSSFLYFLIGNSLKTGNSASTETTYFFEKVNINDYNITFDNQPIGYIICLYIIKTADNEAKKNAYNILINKFKDLIDVPYTQYELALLYKNELEMDTAISLMSNILSDSSKYKNSSSNIDYSILRDEINYYNMEKNWIYQDLDVLIKNIKHSIIIKDITSLKKYVPKTGFDCLVAQKTLSKSWRFSDLQISKRWHTNIVFSNDLEPQSNENEAWLKSYNWGLPLLHTWYFHFKRINYPYDEKIDRGWEWQGIIFGNMF